MKDTDLARVKPTTRRYPRKLAVANALLVLLLLISTAALVLMLYATNLLGKYQYDSSFDSNKDSLDAVEKYEDKITNIALFGVDQRGNEPCRSDSIMVLSIDGKHNKVKLASFMRDSRVYVEGHGMTKLTHAHFYGGPQLAVKTLNQNFQLDIQDYIKVNFNQLADIVDAVGGVEMDVKQYELKEVNKIINDQKRDAGIAGIPLTSAGLQTLNGPQALAYARIRHVGNGDFQRTDRQRELLKCVFNKALKLKVTEYPGAAEKIFPHVTTSLSIGECLEFAGILSQSGVVMEDLRFPLKKDWLTSSGTQTIKGTSYVVMDIDATAESVHQFIYDDINPEATTAPSATK